ncbi:hypothetical protein EYF80_051355 [Liparis tanakae]|uniref:Uncharacterized protein n=1 Tax=Liparis tanakae TaxID=230148 RepID=A0A4Z2FBF4_9TELE|nr:hypothetical protein EYF80_051355 [Liparis tanakae]
MKRSLDISVALPADVEDVLAAFGSHDHGPASRLLWALDVAGRRPLGRRRLRVTGRLIVLFLYSSSPVPLAFILPALSPALLRTSPTDYCQTHSTDPMVGAFRSEFQFISKALEIVELGALRSPLRPRSA